VSNYRHISLTSVLCKALHGTYNICQGQLGFKQHRSCEIQLVMTVNDLLEALNRGTQVDVIPLDLYKAFDTVPTIG